jgi:phosphatidylethanolamine/phosphatidyl-N-methylethanolamine N-methyltransferase
MLTSEIDKKAVQRIYGRWAPVYDLVFGPIFERGRKATIAASERIGGRILEVGVGTGISLPYYSENSRVVGVDLSEHMLRKARQRVTECRLRNVESLAVMDAERLEFPAASFDVVVAQCVVNTVPNPEVALDEFARVLKPGGEIVLFNRVGADTGTRRMLEHLFQPIAKKLGWRSEFPWRRIAVWAASSPHGIHLIERRPMPPLGHFSLIRFGKAAAGAGADWLAAPSGRVIPTIPQDHFQLTTLGA